MNILITGANGFIGSNIIKMISDPNIIFFKGTRKTIDLFSIDNLYKYIINNKIDGIIHCAIEGGNRLTEDNIDILYKNIIIYENLLKFREKFKFIINIASGAEFDRRQSITNISEKELFKSVPIDYYGLSKNIISKLNLLYNGINLRIFGCFYHNELNSRFIKTNILNYINNSPIIIHQNKYMDFIYMEDVATIILYIINNFCEKSMDINMSYEIKYKLSDIANYINKLSKYRVHITIENEIEGLNYTGDGTELKKLGIELKGLTLGINECYNVLL
jgi:nucleoside-diphosphate-sugar epimerase